MSKQFASAGDMQEKTITFKQLSEHCWAFTAQGDPNTGVIITDDSVMVIDVTATPVMSRNVIRELRNITDKPIKYITLSHYHAVRVLGASGYKNEGLEQIISSQDTYDLIVERGQQDMDSEISRFPRLFQSVESIPGLTWPTLTFNNKMTLMMGELEVHIMQLGRGHTKGDTVVWVPSEEVLFSGDLVEFEAGVYTGDAYLSDWPQTLDNIIALKPKALVPGRGPALDTPEKVSQGINYTRDWVTTLYQTVQKAVTQKLDLRTTMKFTRKEMDPKFSHIFIYEHCLPFDVSRAFDEASGIQDPRIWTAQRDAEMWEELQQQQPQ